MITVPKKLRPAANADFLNALKAEQDMTYRSRVPDADKGNMKDMLQFFSQNRPFWNEFMDALVNRIGAVIAHSQMWDGNPFVEFKRGLMQYGDTIEEVQTGLINAHVYDPDEEQMERSLFGTHPIPAQSAFHKIDRQDVYEFTLNENLLRRAFLEPGGLSSFVTNMMAAPTTSDRWDEFLQICSLFAYYESYCGGFFHVKVADPSKDTSGTGQAAKDLLKRIRTLNDLIRFPTTKYNAAHMPSFANPGDMIFITSPEVQAAIDVDALAGAFNVDRAEVPNRVITIPRDKFGLDYGVGLLTTKDFFVLADTLVETASMVNPRKLATQYFLHHWEIISVSKFVPAILFNTTKDDDFIVAFTPPTKVTIGAITDMNGNAISATSVPNNSYSHLAVAVTTADGSGDGVGIDWSVSGNTDPRTKISNYGDLYIGPNEKGVSGKLTITATAVGVNPADGTNYSSISGTTQVTAVVTVAPADGGADAGDPGNDDPAAG